MIDHRWKNKIVLKWHQVPISSQEQGLALGQRCILSTVKQENLLAVTESDPQTIEELETDRQTNRLISNRDERTHLTNELISDQNRNPSYRGGKH